MKTFRLFHVSSLEHMVQMITVDETVINDDSTVPADEKAAAADLKVGSSIRLHYGSNPVKIGTLIRLS